MTTKQSKCKACSKSITDLAYKCNYCGSTFCEDHRIPENHNCVGLELVIRNDEQWGLGILDVDSKPSKQLNVDQAVEVIEEKRSKEETQATEPSADTDDTDSTSEYMDPEIREKAEEVVDLLDNSAPDLDNYKENPESAYNTVEPMVYSSATDPEYQSSPDVSVDGSVKRQESERESVENKHVESRSLLGIPVNKTTIFVVLCIIAAVLYYTVEPSLIL